MDSQFDKLCESIAPIRTTTRMFYPKNVKFSDNFINAFKEEYQNQRKAFGESNTGKPFQPHFERMLKALRFEAKTVEEALRQSDSAIQKKMGPQSSEEINIQEPKSKKFKNLKLKREMRQTGRFPKNNRLGKRGEACYVEWDDETNAYGVFGVDSGHCYSTYMDKTEAEQAAKNRTAWHKARTPRRI